jgi:hypothetical protein
MKKSKLELSEIFFVVDDLLNLMPNNAFLEKDQAEKECKLHNKYSFSERHYEVITLGELLHKQYSKGRDAGEYNDTGQYGP